MESQYVVLAVVIFAFQYRLVEQNRHIGIIRGVISRHKLNKYERRVCRPTIILLVVNALLTCSYDVKGLQRKENSKKSEITMQVAGWSRSHSEFFFFLENRPKIALNQY